MVTKAGKMDPYQEDEIEYKALTRSSSCFLVVGKPGCGKTTLARKLSSTWHSQLVDGTTTIQQSLREDTKLGSQARDLLQKGKELPASLVASILEEKLTSPEVQHYGYVLDGVPCLDGEWMSPAQQMAWLFGSKWKPNIIIIIKIPDADLLRRLNALKVDPLSGEVYSKSSYEPAKPVPKDAVGQHDEVEEDVEETEENLHEAPPPAALPPAVLERLVRRVEDYPERAERRLQDYKKKLLQTIESYMATHPKHCIIELDGNLSPEDLFKALAVKLTAMVVPKALAPKRLIADEEEVDDSEGLDNDAFLDRLAHLETLGPQFRWRRSRWGRYCPVQLAKGNMVQGQLEFSVGFLDKVYSLSSADAVIEFTRCPRRFLLPQQPVIPCKICVVGPPSSGKTSLVRMLAKHYSAEIINVSELVIPFREKNRQDKIEKLKAEESEKAISLVSSKLKAEQDQGGGSAVEVTEDHPEVLAYVQAAVEKFPQDPPPATNEMLVEALSLQVKALHETKVEQGKQQQFGGWVVDGFPHTREQWSVMLEQQVVPDHVVVLTEPDGKEGALLERIKAEAAGDGTEVEEAWSKKYLEFKQHWAHLSAAIKGSAIEPIEADCTAKLEQVERSTVMDLEAVFQHQPVQFSSLEEDADKDDDPSPLEAEEAGEEEEELQRLSRRPWGVSKHYCPVALRDQEVLWPGNPDHALRYRDRLYYFSTEEAKQTFEGCAAEYTKFVQKVPPLRLFLLGPTGAGKTTAGRELASKYEVFHIDFRQYLHELIAPKLKKLFIGEENYDDDNVPELPQEEEDEEEEEEEEDKDFKVPLDEDEMSIYRYLKDDAPLPEEQVVALVEKFWKEEPYKSSGFILEGFPSTEDELRFVAEKGMFADAVAVLEVESKNVVKRFGPRRLDIWRQKRDEYLRVLQERKDKRRKDWNDDKEARKAELIEEHDQAKAAREKNDDEPDEEEEEEFLIQLKDIENEVYEEEADPQILEEEIAARERVETVIKEKVEEQKGTTASLKDVFSELLVPVFTVDANRMKAVVCYSLAKCLSQFTENRRGLLLKSSFVTEEVARALIDHGYKYLSQFGYACPVQSVEDGDLFSGVRPMKRLPVVLGQRVYYISSVEARTKFLGDPSAYVTKPTPLPHYPPKLAVQGLPKSGRTTVANQMVSEFGLMRVTVGEALRYHLAQFPESHLTEQIKSYLLVGETVPDELCVAALERRMLEAECNTRGMVLDGWPLTISQVELMKNHHILPAIFVDLQVSEEECTQRAERQSSQTSSVGPMHNSKMAHTMRAQAYLRHTAAVKQWYEVQHRNWHNVDGQESRWKVWESTTQLVVPRLKEIQLYIDQIPQDRAASVSSMCLTPDAFATHMGEFESYCPVSLCLHGELVDCSRDDQFTCVAEYKKKYYRFATKAELETFLKDPNRYVSPAALQLLPTKEARPLCLSAMEVKAGFPTQMELQGFCPVNYKDGGCRYEALVPGTPEIAVQYQKKIFCFAGEEERNRFMRLPEHYSQVKTPNKLPPLKQATSLQSLPILGYLEQTAAASITTALTTVGCFKPRLPFQDASSSALTYVAYHLKAYNPNSARHLREKYRKKLQEIESKCLLVKELTANLCDQYVDPSTQPTVFKSNLTLFLDLKCALPAGL